MSRCGKLRRILQRPGRRPFSLDSLHHQPSSDKTPAPNNAPKRLLLSLRTFLHAHLTQLADNAGLSALGAPSVPYYDWVHTTSAAHTSCHYSFLFFCCLINRPLGQWEEDECFTTVRQKYLAQDVCAHLATMCRMYNDFGSVGRDREENNLNSIDFPDFCIGYKSRRVVGRR